MRPLAIFLSVPALILTLGLFYFVLNGFLLWLVQFLIPGYVVQGLLPGILGSLVLMVVNWVLHGLFGRSNSPSRRAARVRRGASPRAPSGTRRR